ncbi:segregation/condensation protein A [bacterium]|nr:segregation/condensation protein A [bacterium]MBU1983386.1 segregation/condensation protein A [bacterium]
MKLPRFEGPLDLLLFLVARKEYDILDLPMAEITDSYLAVVEAMGVENLEEAGDYLVMAATLIAIKAKLMLPRPEVEEMEEVEDPRRELIERLLLYQKTKEEAERFGHHEADMLERWETGRSPVPDSARPEPTEYLFPMTIYDLTCAIEDVLRRKESRLFHQVRLHKVSLEERMRWVFALIERLGRFGLLKQLDRDLERMVFIVTFLAVLELAKRQQVRVEQNETFSEIFLSRAHVPELQAA